MIREDVEITFPQWANIRDSFQIIPFQESTEGVKLLEQWKQNESFAARIKKTGFYVAGAMTLLIIITNGFDDFIEAVVFGAIVFAGFYIAYKVYQKTLVQATQDKYFKARNSFTWSLAQNMCDYFGGNFYVFDNAYFFVFNQHMCIFVNANEGSWVGYHKNNIKNVELEHVDLGSTTVSTTQTSGSAYAWTNSYATYSGTSTTVSESTRHYEYRLDIYSDFVDYPHMTVVFPGNRDGEDFAKKARALLSI